MINTSAKKWGVKIILSIVLATFLIANAPVQHNYTAYAAPAEPAATTPETPEQRDAKLNALCKKLFSGRSCSNITEDEYATHKSELGGGTMTLQQWQGSFKANQDEALEEQTKRGLQFIVGMQKVLNKMIWPILIMTGGLMDNSLLFGSGMEARLREIWIPIRNIVNILFVIVLVGIALYNVLGIGDENGTYSIKAILPKLIVGIIVVNFSFMGIKVFLDAINVLTVSIFSLPSQIDEGLGQILAAPDGDKSESIKRMCRAMKDVDVKKEYTPEELRGMDELIVAQVVSQKYQAKYSQVIDFSGFKISPGDTADTIKNNMRNALKGEQAYLAQYERDLTDKGENKLCNEDFLSPQGIVFLSRWDSRNAALAMALNMGKIVFYDQVDLTSVKIDKLIINSIFSIMMWLIYAASFIALFVVLLARLVVMWLAIALSPVLLLMIAVPAIKEKISGFGEISSKFVQNAIAPLGIALSMTIGWIMLRALQNVNSITGDNSRYLDFTNGFPVVGLSTIQDLVVALGTVAVVWLGVFSAASSSIAAPVTDWMKGSLQKAGSWVGTLPLKHAPLFPIEIAGKTGTYTGEQILTAMSDLGSSSAKRNDLANLIRGNTSTKPDVLTDKTKIDTTEKVAGVINRNKIDFNDGSAAKSLSEMKNTNKTLWEKMIKEGGSAGVALGSAMEEYEKAPKEENAKALGQAATKWAEKAHKGVMYEGVKVTSDKTPAKPSTEVKGLDENAKFGGQTLTEIGGNEEAGRRIAKNMTEAFESVRKGLEDGTMTVDKARKILAEPGAQPTTEAELKQWLGDSFGKLQTLLGTTKPEDFVKSIPKAQRTPAPPANPVAPNPAPGTVTQPGTATGPTVDAGNPAPDEPGQEPPSEVA